MGFRKGIPHPFFSEAQTGWGELGWCVVIVFPSRPFLGVGTPRRTPSVKTQDFVSERVSQPSPSIQQLLVTRILDLAPLRELPLNPQILLFVSSSTLRLAASPLPPSVCFLLPVRGGGGEGPRVFFAHSLHPMTL